MTTKESKMKVGARVSLWGDDPKGKGEVIDGPDSLGNWKVRWDTEWDDDSTESWETLPEEVVE